MTRMYGKMEKKTRFYLQRSADMKKIEHPEEIIPFREEKLHEVAARYAEYFTDDCREADEFFMDCALEAAGVAGEYGEVPVGCAIVRDGRLVSLAANGREVYRDATYHAECAAISEACRILGGWRLVGCTMYVTLEPCPMCAGAIINARIPRVVVGTKDARSGALGSIVDMTSLPLNHKPDIKFGVREEECRGILQKFFRERR